MMKKKNKEPRIRTILDLEDISARILATGLVQVRVVEMEGNVRHETSFSVDQLVALKIKKKFEKFVKQLDAIV